MNGGVKICTTDLHKILVSPNQNYAQMIRQENAGNILIKSRKNFAISFCEGFLHVSSGTDQNTHMLSDLWTYNTFQS